MLLNPSHAKWSDVEEATEERTHLKQGIGRGQDWRRKPMEADEKGEANRHLQQGGPTRRPPGSGGRVRRGGRR